MIVHGVGNQTVVDEFLKISAMLPKFSWRIQFFVFRTMSFGEQSESLTCVSPQQLQQRIQAD